MFLRLLGHRPILVPARRAGRRLVRARRRPLRGDGVDGRQPGRRRRGVQHHRRVGHREPLHRRAGRRRRRGARRRLPARRDARRAAGPGVRPPVRRPPPRHGEHREGAAAARLHVPLRPALGSRATPTSGSGARATPTSTGRWSTRCGGRRGTSTPRPRSPSRCAVHEPSDAEMWRSVEATVRDVLLPSLADDWARVTAIQLVGMARFAATRPPDPTPARVAELAEALDRPARQPDRRRPLAGARRPRRRPSSPPSGAVLADAVARDDAAGRRGAGPAAAGRQPPPRRGPRRHRHADAVLPWAAPRCVTRSSAGSASSPAAVVGVAELRRITTGHSRGNWFLELDDGSRFVVRVEQGGVFGTVGRRRVRVHAGGRAARLPGGACALARADRHGDRPAVLRHGLHRGRRRRPSARTAAWHPTWPSTSSAASTSCTASTGAACSTDRRRARRPTCRSSAGPTSTDRRRR